MKNIRFVLSGNFQFLVVKFSIYLNRPVFVMQANTEWSEDIAHALRPFCV